jgi:anti-anti-sigma factor
VQNPVQNPVQSPAHSLLQISVAQQDHVTVVSVAGSLDALTADTLTSALGEQVQAGRTRVVAAFDGVDYMSSAGLRVLLATLKEARRQGGDLRLAAVQDPVMRVLTLSGFTGILKHYPTVPAAVDSFPA